MEGTKIYKLADLCVYCYKTSGVVWTILPDRSRRSSKRATTANSSPSCPSLLLNSRLARQAAAYSTTLRRRQHLNAPNPRTLCSAERPAHAPSARFSSRPELDSQGFDPLSGQGEPCAVMAVPPNEMAVAALPSLPSNPTAAPSLSPLPPLCSPLLEETSPLLAQQEDSSTRHASEQVRVTPAAKQEEEREAQMGQTPSSATSEVALLQQQLNVAARRMSVSSNIDLPAFEGASATTVEEGQRRPRSSSLRAEGGAVTSRPRLADTKRPSTYYEGQPSLYGELDLAEAGRRRSSTPPRQQAGSPSRATISSSTPIASKIRSFSASPRRSSPRPSLGPAFRALKSPFQLSSIPASPNSPPAFMTRSHSSPPLLPSINSGAPISPVELCFTPPTAGLAPPSSTEWPTIDPPAPLIYHQSSFSLSAPNLLATISATSPIPRVPLDSVELDENPEVEEPMSPNALFQEVEKYAGVPREEKRYHALLELVETESGYLDSLRTLVKVSWRRAISLLVPALTLRTLQVYFQTLPFLPMLSAADVVAVVRNAEALLDLHERIVGRLVAVEAEIGWQTGKARTRDLQERKVRKAAGRVARIFVDEVRQRRG